MIRKTKDGWWSVIDADGRTIAQVEDRDWAAELDELHGPKQLNLQMPEAIGVQLAKRAEAAGVTRAAYAYEVLRSHLVGDEPVFRPRATGLAAASTETRQRVASAGGRGRKPKKQSKGTMR
jgi:hypothetical protein